MLELKSVSKVYRTEDVETAALEGIDLEISAGEFVAIMGPSGCGKSTLLNLLGTLDTPSAGSYRIDGESVAGKREKALAHLRRRTIGFVFQSFNLIDNLTVRENVELSLLYRGIRGKEKKTRVDAVLERVGMMHRSRHRPPQLSGGQQQRVAIARALVSDPKVVLADEPTGNLDSAHGEEVMQTLSSLNQDGATVVMVTHSPKDAEHAGRLVNLVDGRIASDESHSEKGVAQ